MTRIDFYFNADSKLRTACRLVARALQQGMRVLIYAPEEDVAREVGAALRALPRPGLAGETPVVIARGADAPIHDEVLLNLHGEAPPFFSRFQRLLEIVGRGSEDRQAARQRFRFYRDRGYRIHHHDLASGRT
jgi:DNA polymerase III subunit chi